MRLINADKLRHELIMGHDLIGAKYVDMADTVKAIPIEFIEKKCRELYEHLYLDESLGVQRVLRDWEKENGK